MNDREILTGVAYYPRVEAGCLRVTGPDAVAFLQRQTTNDVRLLSPSRSVLTVLTSPVGRILDVLRLVQEEEGTILALTLPGFGSRTATFLKSRIFFMDKVSVEDQSAGWFQVDLEGAKAGNLLKELGLEGPGQDLVTFGEVAGRVIRIIGQRGLIGQGFRLVIPAQAGQVLEHALLEAGAEQLAPETHEILRIEAGQAAAHLELDERYTPLESGLDQAISNSKGCYTGQEVIARQLTYDKVTQHLSGLRLSAPVVTGLPVLAEGRVVGNITSFALSPTFGPIALAILKRPFHEPGQIVQVGEGEGIQATVCALPFTSKRPQDIARQFARYDED